MAKQEQFLAKAAKAADIVLAGAGLVSLLIFFYFLYYYWWAGERQFTSVTGVVLYYVLPGSLAAALFASLSGSPVYKINLALFCFSATVSVYGVEVFLQTLDLTIFRPRGTLLSPIYFDSSKKEAQQVAKLIKKQFGVDVDTRTLPEVLADLRKRGIDAVLPPIFIKELLIKQSNGSRKSLINIHGAEVIPLGGISQKVLVQCNENGPWVTFRSDEHGFPNLDGIWQSRRVDVAAVGDSFTYGYCVPLDKSFVGLIRQRFPATLNLGMGAFGPLAELATLQEYLPPFMPKIVLWFYYEENDLGDLQFEKTSPLLMRYLEDDFNQGLMGRQSDIDQALMDQPLMDYVKKERVKIWEKAKQKQISESTMLEALLKVSLLRQKLGLLYGRSSPRKDENIDLFRQILSQAKSHVGAWGGKLYFVYLPAWERYGLADTGVTGQSAQRTEVLTCVKSLGIPIIDLHTAFQAQGDPLSLFPFREPGHYNEAGHRLVAEEVLRRLSSSNRGA